MLTRRQNADVNYDYCAREAGPEARWTHSDEALAHYRAAAALGNKGFIAQLAAERAAEIDAVKAAGHYEQYSLCGWCGRPDLAHKLAVKTPGAVILEARK